MDIFQPRFSTKEQTLFAKRLSFLMRAGVPILESLNLLKKQMRTKSSVKIFESIITDVSNGNFLSSALAKFKGVFGEFAVNIIKVGEEGGILSENLHYLAEELKKKQALKKKVISALIYPVFIVVATLGIVGVLTVFVFPKVMPIFSSINVPLPLTTRALIVISRFLIAYGFWVLLGFILLVFAVSIILKQVKPFRFRVQQLLLRLPIVGKISRDYYLANFCRTLGLLLRGDARLYEAILTTAKTTENLVYKNEFVGISKAVNKGERISAYMARRTQYFPEITGHMVAIGETAGNLSETFMYLAEMYENEVDETTKNLSSLIEPVLMVFMGLLVGFVAISIITPIYSVTQKLTPK